MKKILVVEDKKDERKKAREAVETAGHYCHTAEDLHEAYLALGRFEDAAKLEDQPSSYEGHEKIQWDGVITDLQFPFLTGVQSEMDPDAPKGLEIVLLCHKLGIPCVVCTDVHHHHTGWIKRVLRHITVDVVDDKGTRDDAWQRAFDLLMKQINTSKAAS